MVIHLLRTLAGRGDGLECQVMCDDLEEVVATAEGPTTDIKKQLAEGLMTCGVGVKGLDLWQDHEQLVDSFEARFLARFFEHLRAQANEDVGRQLVAEVL